jgi:ribosomal protein S18 acetylase RimI-like enzyme
MTTVVVEPIDHREPTMAERIHAIQVAGYSQEAELLGSRSFPPLDRTVADIAESDERFFGAYLDGALAGIVALEDDPSGAVMVISSLVVLPAFQRLGVGHALVSTVVKEFGSRLLKVSTGLKNAPALALYARFGFVETRRHLGGAEKLPLVECCRASRGPVPNDKLELL